MVMDVSFLLGPVCMRERCSQSCGEGSRKQEYKPNGEERWKQEYRPNGEERWKQEYKSYGKDNWMWKYKRR